MTTEKHYKLAEVEQLLSVSRSTLLRWITTGRLRAVKFSGEPGAPSRSGHWRVPESALTDLQCRKS